VSLPTTVLSTGCIVDGVNAWLRTVLVPPAVVKRSSVTPAAGQATLVALASVQGALALRPPGCR
jgi:hypothetical protein